MRERAARIDWATFKEAQLVMKLIDLYKFKLAYRDNSFINLKIIEGD